MTFSNLIKSIKESEGYRARVYKCTEGYDTIGYGFAIKDLKLTRDVCDIILKEKLLKINNILENRFDWYPTAPIVIQDVVVEMVYQLGYTGFSKFKKTIYYLETEQYTEAADEMLDSLWARQTPNRAKKLSEKVRSCEKNR
tara:strand:- start:465 stop:887 length:423 start_codon:yes stop_codon:yes gene_type:complete